MATGPGFPSAQNTFVPNLDASGRLIVSFSRNAKKFPIMEWAQLTETKRTLGYYLKLSAQEAARVVSSNDYYWNRGNERPQRNDGLEQFNLIPFTTRRSDYGFNIDDDTKDQAEWNIQEQHAQIHAQKAMTDRTIRALEVLTTASNWQTTADPDIAADHTSTASALAGGYINAGTSTNPYLKIALDKIAVAINLDSLGIVEPDKLMVVINPNTARLLAESQEIHDYLKGSPAALDEIKSGTSPNARYGPGLPSTIYGYKVIVDNTVKVTSRKGATLSKSFAFPDQTLAVVSRVGEMTGSYGGPSWSTLTLFWYKDELTLEEFDDRKNRRFEYHVVQDIVPVLTSPISGYLLTATSSAAS